MKFTAFTAAVIALAAGSATAEGFYFSGKLSAQTQSHTIERDTEGVVLPVPDVGGVSLVEQTDAAVGIGLGYEQNIGTGPLFWGAEVFYNAETGESRNINGVLVTDLELEASYGARLIAGTNVTDTVKLYTHAGVTQVDFDVTNSYTFAPPVTDDSYSETGFSYGVGASVAVSDSVALFTEYTAVTGIEFDGIAEVAGGTGRENPNTLDLSALAIGVKYSF